MITRRNLFKILLITPFVDNVVKEIPLTRDWTIFSGHVFDNEVDVSLFGIPYHQSNTSTGQWLGFERK